MIRQIRSKEDPLAHDQSCPLHEPRGQRTCWGFSQRRQRCTKKANNTSTPHGYLPMCRLHVSQMVRAGSCEAILPCGFKCGRTFHWEPPYFQLCASHKDSDMPCFLMKLPLELRREIFGRLCPDRSLRASDSVREQLWEPPLRELASMCRLNRQLHDEVTSFLYGRRPFTVGITDGAISLCNGRWSMLNSDMEQFMPRSHSVHWDGAQSMPGGHALQSDGGQFMPGGHALQDYQMQLMLLDRQNRQRLLLARNPQAGLSAISGERATLKPPKPPSREQTSSEWLPRIGIGNFRKIQSFRIDIGIDYNCTRLQNCLASQENPDRGPYDVCDHVHRLVQLLKDVAHIRELHVNITMCGGHRDSAKASELAKLVLRPFEQLRNISTTRIVAVVIDADARIPPPARQGNLHVTDRHFLEFGEQWKQLLSSSLPVPDMPPICRAYEKLERVVDTLNPISAALGPPSQQTSLKSFLHDARVAREANEADEFGVISDRIMDISWQSLDGLKGLQQRIQDNAAELHHSMVAVRGCEPGPSTAPAFAPRVENWIG